MDQRTCSIDGCGLRHEAKGYCSMHYKRWKAHGDPMICGPVILPCAVDGCEQRGTRAGAKGMCTAHRRQHVRREMLAAAAPCTIPGCERPLLHKRDGWCDRHQRHWRTYGHPVHEPPKQLVLPIKFRAENVSCQDCGVTWTVTRWTRGGRRPERCEPCRRSRVNRSSLARSRRHPAAVRAAKVKWRTNNPDKMAAARAAWAVANPDRLRAYARATKRRYPEANRSYVRARNARKRQLSTVPFTPSQLRQRLAYYGRCWMCGGRAEVIDHVKPLSKGGAHMLCNLRPACWPCNSAKGARWPWPTTTTAMREVLDR